MIAFTSIATNYLAKARVLADSLKRYHPDITFMICLVEREIPPEAYDGGFFDQIITADQLEIPEFLSFIFRHTVVEACTAVKPFFFKYLIKNYTNENPFIYFDPDIIIVSPLLELIETLQSHNVVLTPHLLEPEETLDAIADNELCALRHGVFNLGFIALTDAPEVLKLVDWWSDRLYRFCYADYGNALFVDQKWFDFAPCFFEGIHIIRHKGYNVAPWNLSRRKVVLDDQGSYKIGDFPVRFFHFSGMDSGANELMLAKYAGRESAVFRLRNHYLEKCQEFGQEYFQRIPWTYAYYHDGVRILPEQRSFYRSNLELQRRFPNPFNSRDYLALGESVQTSCPASLEPDLKVAKLEALLEVILKSKSWRLTAPLRNLKAFLAGKCQRLR